MRSNKHGISVAVSSTEVAVGKSVGLPDRNTSRVRLELDGVVLLGKLRIHRVFVTATGLSVVFVQRTARLVLSFVRG